jgi:hypothetical protein
VVAVSLVFPDRRDDAFREKSVRRSKTTLLPPLDRNNPEPSTHAREGLEMGLESALTGTD